MKRSPLRRKTPLKRTGFKKPQSTEKPKRKRRSGLRPVSKAKESWLKQYREMCSTDAPFQRPNGYGAPMHKDLLERHHVFGRIGERILAYVYVTKQTHRWIHAHSREAYEEGWLQPEYKGHVSSGKWPRPWAASCESRWPSSLKRK